MNQFHNRIYVEPFAGGAGAALSLLINEQVKEILINDADPCIYAFWYSVKHLNQELQGKILTADLSIEEWQKQKKIVKEKNSKNPLKLGYATFYLNRCNRSGIIRGGVIGGMQQTGKYKIDARFNKEELVRRICFLRLYADRIQISNHDAIELLQSLENDSKKYFLYLDPPYFKKADRLYLNYYKNDDHTVLSEYLKKTHLPWLLTYDAVAQIQQMYVDHESQLFDLNYCAVGAKKGTEIMIYSKNLKYYRNSSIAV